MEHLHDLHVSINFRHASFSHDVQVLVLMVFHPPAPGRYKLITYANMRQPDNLRQTTKTSAHDSAD